MKKLAITFVVLSVFTTLFGQESVPRNLRNLLESKTTDQIMMALEPSMKMKEEDFNKLRGINDGPNPNEFLLHVFASPEKNPEPNKKFWACYIAPIVYIPGFHIPNCYMQPLNHIVGIGPTPHAALVDMVVKLVEKKIIDPAWLRERLKS